MSDLNKELEEANAALWRCVEFSGEDTSGGIPSWPPLHEFAVQAVEQLRKDSDEGTDELATELADERTLVASLERQLEEAKEKLELERRGYGDALKRVARERDEAAGAYGEPLQACQARCRELEAVLARLQGEEEGNGDR